MKWLRQCTVTQVAHEDRWWCYCWSQEWHPAKSAQMLHKESTHRGHIRVLEWAVHNDILALYKSDYYYYYYQMSTVHWLHLVLFSCWCRQRWLPHVRRRQRINKEIFKYESNYKQQNANKPAKREPTHRISCYTARVRKTSFVPLGRDGEVFQEEMVENWSEMYRHVIKCCTFCIIKSFAVGALTTTTQFLITV